MKNLVRQMVSQLTASSTVSPDARLAVQRAAADQGALVDIRHG